jgi:ParB family chromosome partitioning protein
MTCARVGHIRIVHKQPIAVRPIGDGRYQIIKGERCWRAHCLLRDEGKLEELTILPFVRKVTDDEMSIDAIIEEPRQSRPVGLEEALAFRGWSTPATRSSVLRASSASRNGA